MNWDTSDSPTEPSATRAGRRPPPIPVKIKDLRKPGGHLPGVSPGTRQGRRMGEATPFSRTDNAPAPNPSGRRRNPSQTQQMVAPDSHPTGAKDPQVNSGERLWDVLVPDDGVYRVPARSPEEAKNALATWFREDQDDPAQARNIDPTSLSVQPAPRTVDPRSEGVTYEARLREAIRDMVREVVRKKAGGGGYVLYGPNKGKKKNPKPAGEFPTRLAAKRAELARFPPKDPEQLKKTRKRLDKLLKDPKKRAAAEKDDLSNRQKPKTVGRPSGARKKKTEAFVRMMVRDLQERLFSEAPIPVADLSNFPRNPPPSPSATNATVDWVGRSRVWAWIDDKCPPGHVLVKEPGYVQYDVDVKHVKLDQSGSGMGEDRHIRERLFREDEIPGSPWDERISSLHPDAISSDKRLHALHRGIEKASLGGLDHAHKSLAKVLRGMARVNPGEVAHDPERRKTFMPVGLDCDGIEIGPVHLYIDGGHVKIEISQEARAQIAELEPDQARDLRGGLMSFQEDHLPKIDVARKAWNDRDAYLDKLHGKLEKHVGGMSGVEMHLAKQLLSKGGRKR